MVDTRPTYKIKKAVGHKKQGAWNKYFLYNIPHYSNYSNVTYENIL